MDFGDVPVSWEKPTSKPSGHGPPGLPPRKPPQSFGLFGFTPAGSSRSRKVWRVDEDGIVHGFSVNNSVEERAKRDNYLARIATLNKLNKVASENAALAADLIRKEDEKELERAKSEDQGWPAVVRMHYLSRINEDFDPITAEQFAWMMDVAYEGERPDDDRLPKSLPPEVTTSQGDDRHVPGYVWRVTDDLNRRHVDELAYRATVTATQFRVLVLTMVVALSGLVMAMVLAVS